MGRYFEYTDEMLEFIKNNVAGTPLQSLTDKFNERFGTGRTKRQILDAARCRGWSTGLLHQCTLFPPYVQDFIRENHSGNRAREMVGLLNKAFGLEYTVDQVSRYYIKHGLRSGVGSTYVPIGTVKLRKTEQMFYEKVADGTDSGKNWKPKHVVVWEAAHGPVPDGKVLIFLDGDTRNYALNNLMLCTKQVRLEMNRKGLRFQNPEATKTGALIAQVNVAVHARKNKEDSDATAAERHA